MFRDFKNVWTPVLLQRQLRKKPVAVRIAGEPLVVFRTPGGGVAALRDQCPHRGVALSQGEVTADGTLACPFHGWQVDGRGACARVPFNPQAKRERLGAVAFPAREAGGLVWVHTAPRGAAVLEPEIPEALAHARSGLFALEVTWQTHWTRVMENMMDNAHLPFVHRRTLGRQLRSNLRPDSTLQVDFEPRGRGFFIAGRQDQTLLAGLHDFAPPNRVAIYLDGPAGAVRVHIFCIPVAELTTRLLIVGDFGRWNWLARLFLPLNRYIVQEDKGVVESAQPPEVPPPGVEPSVATDRGTLAFRKYYHAHLKEAEPAATHAAVSRPR
jgi:phenylpropionate dioxygenase-like ring-hydroxylating dioxygenase large terminal subunit